MTATTTEDHLGSGQQAGDITVIEETKTSVLVDGRNGKMPWSKRKVALLAALPLMGGLTAIATPWAVDHIEDHLEAETLADLAAAGIDTSAVAVDFDYRDGEVRGTLPAGTTAPDVVGSVDDALLRDLDVLATAAEPEPPAPEPTAVVVAPTGTTEVGVELADGVMTLQGSVLTEGHRTDLVQAASSVVGAANVDDQLEVTGLEATVAGADARIADLSATIAATAGADTARIDLTDTDLTASASTTDPQVGDAIERAADAASVDATAEVDVVATTADQAVTAVLANGAMTLTGTVPTEADRTRLVEAAEAVVGVDQVDDQLMVTGLPSAVEGSEERIEAVLAVLGAVGPDDAAEVVMTDTDLSVTASIDAAPDEIEALEGLLAGVAVETSATDLTTSRSDIDVEVDALSAELDALQADIRANVVFETATAILDARAQATLDEVAAAMARHQLPVVAVIGHTDSVGRADDNQALSAERAAAVVAYLTNAGVDPSRLQASGAGESDPIAPNDTIDGQAENRRVEIVALPGF